jgi:hypothetical protein
MTSGAMVAQVAVGKESMNTKDIGERSEGQVLAALLSAGKVVLMPFGDNQRYDFVIDDAGKFLRVQCKTGHLREGSVIFATCSSSVHRRGGIRRTYDGDVDFFGVYCPEMRSCYLIPIVELRGKTRNASLRVDEPKNGQKKGVRWAKDFLIKIDELA